MSRTPLAIAAALMIGAGLPAAAFASPAFPKAAKAGAPKFESDTALDAAVAGPARSAANKARDGARHPAESLAFWDLQPGASIIELSPGGGYWTEILAPYAKATGGRYAAGVSDKGRDPFLAKYADKAVFGDVAAVPLTKTTPMGVAGAADFVLTARNIHSFMGQGTLDKVMAESFAALKPGGVFAVEEHRADPRPEKPEVSDGYVSEATVIAAAERAGFKLEARSDINANPKDTKDHPFGVWTLPPTRQTAPSGQAPDPAFDRTKYDAIGESDRMTLRFRKPG
jgi:predicted methyltransferase